jgi:hypothetical protein
MLRKIIVIISVIALSYSVLGGLRLAAETKKEEKSMQENNRIRITMTLDEFNNLKCKDFVPFPEKKVKHKIGDNRLRKFYCFKPLLSVAMREVDINSYFEIIFEKDRITEINQYDLKGNLIKQHTEIYCWI